MSDQAIMTETPQAAPPDASAAPERAWAEPNAKGYYPEDALEHIYAPGLLGALLLIEQADGWRFGLEVVLPDGSNIYLPRATDTSYPSRELAITAVCEELIAWCAEQRTGKRRQKHKEAAGQLQEWALAEENAAAFAEQGARVPNPQEEIREESQAPQSAEAAQNEQGADPGAVTLHARTTAEGELRWIPIEELHESPWNPRTLYPEAAMQELVESMRASGFRDWLPLMVRPREERDSDGQLVRSAGGYEIGAGHRRRRAAEIAGIKLIPCIVRDLSDAEFLDILNFDNSGREDVHPLHEAAGWRVWMERTGKGVLDIAARIGQSKEYVYQRLKYAALIPEVQKSFLDGEITARHAIMIARLEPEMQLRALQEGCFDDTRSRGRRDHELVGYRELASWIEEQKAGADLTEVVFDRDDAALVPAAGACGPCEKRAEDFCTDRQCFESKIEAHIRQKAAAGLVAISNAYEAKEVPAGVLPEKEWQEIYETAAPFGDEEAEEGEEIEEDSCSFAEQAIVAHGRDRGKTMRICRNPKCPVHGRRLNAELQRKADAPKDFWSEREAALPKKIENESRYALLRAVVAKKIDWKVPHEQLQIVALALLPGGGCTEEFVRALAAPGGLTNFKSTSQVEGDLQKLIRAPLGSPAADWLPRIVMALALKENAKEYTWKDSPDFKRLLQAAQALGIDAKAIEKETSERIWADFRARRDKAKAKQPAAAKPAAKPPTPKEATAKSGTRREVTPADTGEAPGAQLSAKGKRRVAAAKKALAKKPAAKKPPVPKKKGALAKKVPAKGNPVEWAKHKREQIAALKGKKK